MCDEKLYDACKQGEVEEVKKYLSQDANVNFKDEYQKTPLYVASAYGHEAIVKLLLEKGGDPHAKIDGKSTPLYVASWNGHEAIVKLLLEKGGDPNVKDEDKSTPLHMASWNGHEAVVKLLLEKGGDPNAKTNTPLDFAKRRNRKTIIQLLEDEPRRRQEQREQEERRREKSHDLENNNSDLQARLKELEEDNIELKKHLADIQADLKETKEDKMKSTKLNDDLELEMNEIKKENIKSNNQRKELKAQLKEIIESQIVEKYNDFDDPECYVHPDKNTRFSNQKKKVPCLTIIKAWGHKKNPMSQPGTMDLELGEKVFLIEQHEGGWWDISHPEKGQACVHNSCFNILEVGCVWGYPDNLYSRPGDSELKQGERVVMCEKYKKDWCKVFHLEKHEELLVHCSIFS